MARGRTCPTCGGRTDRAGNSNCLCILPGPQFFTMVLEAGKVTGQVQAPAPGPFASYVEGQRVRVEVRCDTRADVEDFLASMQMMADFARGVLDDLDKQIITGALVPVATGTGTWVLRMPKRGDVWLPDAPIWKTGAFDVDAALDQAEAAAGLRVEIAPPPPPPPADLPKDPFELP